MNQSVLLRTWTKSVSQSGKFSKTGLRYDAGSWIAEILDDIWASYDVIKTIKQSDSQFQEFLLPHEVPRLPRDCFDVQEFLFSPKGQSQFEQEGWTVRIEQIPWEPQVQDQLMTDQPLPQPLLTDGLQGQIAQKKRQALNSQKGYKAKGQKNKSSLPSSNPTSRAQQKQPNPKKQGGRSPQQTTTGPILLLKQNPIDQWTPLQIHLAHPSKHHTPIVSFETPKGKKTYSPRQPKHHPKKSPGQQSTSCSQTVEQPFSTCQIQD